MSNYAKTLEDLINRLGPIDPNGSNGNDPGNYDNCQINNAQKWWISFFVALIFFIFANPVAFAITSEITTSLGGPKFCRKGGSTWVGLIVHTVVVFFFVRLLLH